jgi:hypothetical protein
MMKQTICLLLNIIFATFYSNLVICQEKPENHLLNKIGELKLPLNNQSSAFTYNIHVYSESGEAFLFIEQTFRNAIDIYSLKSEKFIKTIRIPKSFASEQPIGFFVNNFDSIYILLTKSNNLALINSDGMIIDKTKSLALDNEITPVIFSSHPVIKIDKNLLISGYFSLPVKNTQVLSCIVFNIEDKTIQYKTPVSMEYQKGWWGRTLYIPTLYQTYNKEKGLIVNSFPVDNYIYVNNNKSKTLKKYYAGSEIIKQVSPVSKKAKANISGLDIENHFAKNGYYTAIKFDEYQNIYYRCLIRPIRENQKFSSKRNSSIILLNEKFGILGEWEVPDKNDLFKSFIYKKGLYILNEVLYQQNQDTLCFDIYQFKNSLR